MSWTHLRDKNVKGRKDYRCYLCEGEIPTGVTHVNRVGIDENGLSSIRMHLECEKITHSWDEDHWEGGIDHADFREELNHNREREAAKNMRWLSQ